MPLQRPTRAEWPTCSSSPTPQRRMRDCSSPRARSTSPPALTVMLRAMLLRAATPAGAEGVPAANDIGTKRRSAEALERAGAPLAAAMVRAAAAERGCCGDGEPVGARAAGGRTVTEDASGGRPSALPDGPASPPATVVPESLAEQIDRLAHDLAAHR